MMEPVHNFKQYSQRIWVNSCLNAVRNHGSVSKATLCQELGISITSINAILKTLIEDGYVEKAGVGESNGGRRPELLSIKRDGAFFMGLEFSADGIFCAVLDLERKIHYKRFCGLPHDIDSGHLMDQILKELQEALLSLGEARERLCGVAIGASGFLDYQKGMLVFYSQRPAWSNTQLLDRVKETFRCPVWLINNVDGMPYAYKWVACSGVCEDHVMMAIRYGFKISAFANNRRIKGAHDYTGEIGHMRVGDSNRLCRCGKHGCFDTEVTYTAIAQKVAEGIRVGRFQGLNQRIHEQGYFSIDLFTDACNGGDQEAVELMEETITNLCSAISWICYMIDPAAVMVSSKLDKFKHFYDMIRNTLYKKYENNFTYGKFKVCPAPFGEFLGAVGAAAYVYEELFGDCGLTV